MSWLPNEPDRYYLEYLFYGLLFIAIGSGHFRFLTGYTLVAICVAIFLYCIYRIGVDLVNSPSFSGILLMNNIDRIFVAVTVIAFGLPKYFPSWLTSNTTALGNGIALVIYALYGLLK